METDKTNPRVNSLYFLPERGEMSGFVARFPWANTELGDIESWSPTLRTMVSTVLYSENPMLLLWGKDHVQIYNDKYIPVLGERHPKALGAPAEKTWSDIWNVIGPIFKDIFINKKSYSIHDLLFLLHSSNNIIEERYFSFSPAPVLDEKGTVLGIFSPVAETTKDVIASRQKKLLHDLSLTVGTTSSVENIFIRAEELLKTDSRDYASVQIYQVDLTHSQATLVCQSQGEPVQKVLDLGSKTRLAKVLSEAAVNPSLQILDDIIAPLPANTLHGGEAAFSETVIIPLNIAAFHEKPFVAIFTSHPYISDRAFYVDFYNSIADRLSSEINRIEFRKLEERKNDLLRELFSQAPIAICMLDGPDFIVELANNRMLELWGKTKTQVLNKPVFEGIPDASGQGFEQILRKVYTAGEKHISQESAITLTRNGKDEEVFVKFIYEPIYNSEREITGVLAVAEEITEQVKSKQFLEKQATQLRNLFLQAPAAIATFTGKDHVFESANELFLKLVNKEGLEGQPGRRAIQEFTSQGIWDRFDEVYKYGQPFVASEYKLQIDGNENKKENRYFNFVIQPVLGPAGNIERILLHLVEITAHVKARKEIEELQTRQKLAIEAANFGTFEWNIPASKFIYSTRLAKMFGFQNDKGLTQQSFADSIHPDDQSIRSEAHKKAFETGALFYEARVIWPDKSVHWIRMNGKVTYDEKGEPERMYGTGLDITEQKALSQELQRQVEERTNSLRMMNEDLKKSEERYHKMTEEVQDYAILLLDTDGYIQNWNAGAQKIKGYSEREIISKNFRVFYMPEDLERKLPETLLKQAKETGRASQEGWRMRKDGTRFWASVVITALHDSDNNIIGFSKVTRDLTERKFAEDKMKQYLSELEVQNRELEQFAYVASHDLQEPLRKIRTFLDLVKSNLGNPDLVNRYFEKIDSSAKRMTDLIRSILNYSRLSTTKDEFAVVDLDSVLKGVLADLELLMQEKNATIKSDPLPVIEGSTSQMQQLFLNLIGNSLKFSTETPLIEINVKHLAADELPKNDKFLTGKKYILLTFKDNGIGFDQKYSEQVFTIFQRLHTRDVYSGTGIGLALCRRIVENHHGMITVQSQPGVGTTFSVYLPDERTHKSVE